MPCSNECASSCTSSHGMPKTCTRKASIRRWRVTMRLAELPRPSSVKREALALVAHDEAVVHEAPHHLERGRLRDADRAGQVGLRRVDARLVHPEELLEVLLDGRGERSPCAASLPGGGAAVRAPRYRRGGGGTSCDHGAHARRGSARGRGRLRCSLRGGRRGRRAEPRRPRLDDLGQQPACGSRAPRPRCSPSATRRRLEAGLVAAARRRRRGAAALSHAASRSAASAATSTWPRASRAASRAFDARTGTAALDARARLDQHRLRADAEGRSSASRARPSTTPPAATSTSRPPTSCGRSTCTAARRARGWPDRRCRSTSSTSTSGARSRSATGTSTSASPRTATAAPTAAACSPCRPSPAPSTTPGRSVTTPDGAPGGGGIWGWGGVAITADGHVWAASANANVAGGADEAQRSRRVGRRAQLRARPGRREPRAGHADQGRLRLRLDADRLQRRRAAARSSPPRARTVRSTSGSAPSWPPGRSSGSCSRSRRRSTDRPPGIRRRSSCSSRLTQGYSGQPSGLDALAVTKGCRLRRPGRRASAVS